MTHAVFLDRISDLAARQGPPPRMTPANPQEQLEQFPPDWRIVQRLADFAFALPHVVERPTQIAPIGSRAMWLTTDIPGNPEAFLVGREFAHIHNPPIGSMHVTLPEPYRSRAIAKGWAIRHPFAVRGLGPADAVFVFAPRDETELAWASLLLEISHGNACEALVA
jgi:hypothetical protein